MLNALDKCLVAAVLAIALVTVGPAAAEEIPAAAEARKVTASADDWRFGLELYGFLPTISATAVYGGDSGGDSKLNLEDTIDFDLNFVLMGIVGAFKDNWSFMVDALYSDVDIDAKGTVTGRSSSHIPLSENVRVDVGLQTWVVTPTVGYDLFANDKMNLTVLAGARYLWIKTSLDVASSNQIKYHERKLSESEDNWDGIVGVRGQVQLTDKWYLPYWADVGAGDSDLTWQVFGGVGYRFKYFDLVGGYRYLAWEFGGDYVIDDLSMSGPMFGLKFSF